MEDLYYLIKKAGLGVKQSASECMLIYPEVS